MTQSSKYNTNILLNQTWGAILSFDKRSVKNAFSSSMLASLTKSSSMNLCLVPFFKTSRTWIGMNAPFGSSKILIKVSESAVSSICNCSARTVLISSVFFGKALLFSKKYKKDTRFLGALKIDFLDRQISFENIPLTQARLIGKALRGFVKNSGASHLRSFLCTYSTVP